MNIDRDDLVRRLTDDHRFLRTLPDPRHSGVKMEAWERACKDICEAALALRSDECWPTIRRLLSYCNFKWEGDGVTADQAYEYLKECIDDLERQNHSLREDIVDLSRMHREAINNLVAAKMEANNEQ